MSRVSNIKAQLATNFKAMDGMVSVLNDAPDLTPTEFPAVIIANPTLEAGEYLNVMVDGRALTLVYHFKFRFLLGTPLGTVVDWDKSLVDWGVNLLGCLYGHMHLKASPSATSGYCFDSGMDGVFDSSQHTVIYNGAEYIGFELNWYVKAASDFTADD